jgi:hypothetical protein
MRSSRSQTAEVPSRLSDSEFWRLTEDLSEPDGTFRYENLLSNELVFARIVPDLVARTKPGGVFLGVGSEQNFTYIAAMRPGLAFITDIRRGNLQLHLMYKALFELSADRAEFISRLFNRTRPEAVTSASSAADLMAAFSNASGAGEAAYAANLEAVDDRLMKTHALPLSPEDLAGIARVYRAFDWYGPAMSYSATTSLDASLGAPGPSYSSLMTQVDNAGQALGYLGSEEKFAFVKELERRNLVVPVVGNFSGPKALRAIGAYVRDRGATVGAFYVSNVEEYLGRGGMLQTFCANVAALPLDEGSVFIRPRGFSIDTSLTLAAAPRVSRTTATARPSDATKRIGDSDVRFEPGAGVVPMAPEVKRCAQR